LAEVGVQSSRDLGDRDALQAWLGVLGDHAGADEALRLAAEREAVCREVGDTLGLVDAALARSRACANLGWVDEALAALTRAEEAARSDGPDDVQAAHLLRATLEDAVRTVRALLCHSWDEAEALRLFTLEARLTTELVSLAGIVSTTEDLTHLRERHGVRGRLTLDVDPAELTLLWWSQAGRPHHLSPLANTAVNTLFANSGSNLGSGDPSGSVSCSLIATSPVSPSPSGAAAGR
jgi:hypothetical protein